MSTNPDSLILPVKQNHLTSDMLDTIALIKVETKKTEFRIHKGILCNASSFFRAALEGGFREGLEQTIEMPETSADTFKLFQVWLYSGQFANPPAPINDEQAWNDFIELYIFADAHGIPKLQNDTIDVLVKLYNGGTVVSAKSIKKIYDESLSNGPLRRFMVDVGLHLEWEGSKWLKQASIPQEWLADLILEQAKLIKRQLRIAALKSTKYHVEI